MGKIYKRPTFYVDNGDPNVAHMMGVHGYDRVNNPGDALIVLFSGGADIHPMFYGDRKSEMTSCDYTRDLMDLNLLRNMNEDQIPVGICRGAQFLNVLAGNGRLYQHVNNHQSDHTLVLNTEVKNPLGGASLFKRGDAVKVTSTHHQMMIPGPGSDVLAYANVASEKFGYNTKPLVKHDTMASRMADRDPEVVYFWTPQHSSGVLCFQPHPEYINEPTSDETTKLFFGLLESMGLISKDVMGQVFDQREKRLPAFLARRAEVMAARAKSAVPTVTSLK